MLSRAELERLLPAHARRDGGLVGSGVIRRQEDYEAPEQLPFKVCPPGRMHVCTALCLSLFLRFCPA